MAVSGYLSPDDEWQQFEASWLDVLRAHGVDMFHMTEFECRKAAFEFWTDQTRIEFLGQLIGLIARHAVVGVGAAIVLNDYEALSAEDRARLGHPYAMCGLKAVADTLKWIDNELERGVAAGQWTVTNKGKNVPVEFVFEAGDEGAGELNHQLEKEQASGKYAGRIVRWSFENKRGVGALQAADFAAYETTKQLVRTIGAEERAMRKSLETFVSKTPYVAEYFDARSMGDLLQIVRRDESR
jgi:hypothetical protein